MCVTILFKYISFIFSIYQKRLLLHLSSFAEGWMLEWYPIFQFYLNILLHSVIYRFKIHKKMFAQNFKAIHTDAIIILNYYYIEILLHRVIN